MPESPAVERACKSLEHLRKKVADLARNGSVSPALLQAALDDCADPVVVTDERARILMVNGRAARLLGASPRELQQLTVWDITHANYQADFEILWKEFIRAGRQRGEYGLRRMDGSLAEVAYCSCANVLPGRSMAVLHPLG